MFGWLRKAKSPKREIIINAESLEVRVALLESGRLEEYQVEHPTEERIVGSVFKGRIQNLEHDLQAAFVDIGLKKNAFLHYWDMLPDDDARLEGEDGPRSGSSSKRRRFSNEDIAKWFPAGSDIVVQVTKGAIGTKGPRVTASISLPGRYLVMMPSCKLTGVSRKIEDEKERKRLRKILSQLQIPENTGLIVRTVGAGARKGSFVQDLADLTETWHELEKNIRERQSPCCLYEEPKLLERVVRDWVTDDLDRILIDAPAEYEKMRELAARVSRRAKSRLQLYEGDLPIFDQFGVERQLEEAFQRKVPLKSGGYLIFDETEALVSIDVNSGRHKGSGSQEDAILNVNLEAVEEVARQLRLRNIGGLLVIDLIDMKARKNQHAVYRAMKAALQRDRARINVLPISELGLMEMTRQRVDKGVLSSAMVDCPYCRGHGCVRSPLAMSVHLQRQVTAALRKRKSAGGSMDLQIIVHPTVLDRLRKEDEGILLDLQARFAGNLSFKSDPARHMESFEIRDAATGEVLYSSTDR